MGKKSKRTNPTPIGATPQLTHAPFAALAARSGAAVDAPRAAGAPAAGAPVGPAPGEKSRGRLVLRRETKHRGGKAVIVIVGFDALPAIDEGAIAALAGELKQALACGGTVAERAIVLQGDRAAKVAELLRAQGFRVEGVTS